MFKKILIIFGGSLCMLAIFANQLGIDNDAGWGRGRVLILKLGVIFIALSILLFIFENQIHNINVQISNFLKLVGRERIIQVIFVLVGIIITSTYIWILNPSERNADTTYNYFGQLARGFRQAHLYIPQEPSEQLLALSNPYDTILRKQSGIEDFPWDVSLYKGKFYLYWGPTPALLLFPLRDEVLSKVEDFHLALIFALGLFFYSALIVTSFWQALKQAPLWTLTSTLLVLGLSTTVTTMLKRAEVHEVAVFASQFFFIGGCYWACSSLSDAVYSTRKLTLASIHWVFAIGARIVILPAVMTGAFLIAYPLLSGFSKNWKARLGPLFAIGFPIIAEGIFLALYNYSRFGSILEFGVRYQLTNVDYTQFSNSFGLQYFLHNLRVYFLYPINFKARFPYISLSGYLAATNMISGLFFISPFIILILLPFFRLLTYNNKDSLSPAYLYKLFLLLAGTALISASIIFNFYFITLRYTLDFLPAALILISLSLGLEYESSRGKTLSTGILSFLFITTAFTNVATGILLAIPKNGIDFMTNLLNDISKIAGLK